MPSYGYRGLNQGGRQVSGVRDAESARALRATLRAEGVFVTEVHDAHQKARGGSGLKREVDLKGYFDRVTPQDVAVATRQLATLLRAGIPLAESLGALMDQVESDKFRRTLADVRMRVNEGTSFADALLQHPKIFSDLYINMVRAGETAGNLEDVLARLATFMQSQALLRGKVKSALTYPAVLALAAIAMTGFLMAVVVPQIVQIFEGTDDRALPWNTRLVIWVSGAFADWWWLFLLLAVGGYFGFRYWRKTEKGRHTWDRFVLRMWMVRDMVKMVAIARFSRTLGTMLQSGVPLLRALEIVKAVLGNVVLIRAIEDARTAIREGESIAQPLAKSGHFPPMVTQMVAVGERSGQLEQMLQTVAEAYEVEVDLRVGRLTSVLGPVVILFMGGTIGFIVVSILMPLMEMNDMIG
ncbi:MAG: type II secretion system inner membrane protein GspF [Deltaproteobacteria bacterium]|nr:type II secretion system inner membrane protein GspF [Deltaproteobacteria bacterium]